MSDTKSEEAIVGGIFVIVVTSLIAAAATMWSGLVISKMWLWFAVPVFHLPVLSVAQAAGLGMLGTALRGYGAGRESRPDDTALTPFWKMFQAGFLTPALGLLIAFVLKSVAL